MAGFQLLHASGNAVDIPFQLPAQDIVAVAHEVVGALVVDHVEVVSEAEKPVIASLAVDIVEIVVTQLAQRGVVRCKSAAEPANGGHPIHRIGVVGRNLLHPGHDAVKIHDAVGAGNYALHAVDQIPVLGLVFGQTLLNPGNLRPHRLNLIFVHKEHKARAGDAAYTPAHNDEQRLLVAGGYAVHHGIRALGIRHLAGLVVEHRNPVVVRVIIQPPGLHAVGRCLGVEHRASKRVHAQVTAPGALVKQSVHLGLHRAYRLTVLLDACPQLRHGRRERSRRTHRRDGVAAWHVDLAVAHINPVGTGPAVEHRRALGVLRQVAHAVPGGLCRAAGHIPVRRHRGEAVGQAHVHGFTFPFRAVLRQRELRIHRPVKRQHV